MTLKNDKKIHNLSDCELKNELRDFNDFSMDDLDGSNDIDENFVSGESLPLEENIHQINKDLGCSHRTISNVLFCQKITIVENGWEHYYLCSVIILNIIYVCGYVVLKLKT